MADGSDKKLQGAFEHAVNECRRGAPKSDIMDDVTTIVRDAVEAPVGFAKAGSQRKGVADARSDRDYLMKKPNGEDFTRQDRRDIKEAIEEELQGKVSNVTIKTNAIQAETEPGYPDFDLVPADVDYKARNQTGFRQHKTLPDQEPLTKAARNASTGLRNVPGLKDKKSTPGYVLDQAAARAAAENPEAGSYEVFCAALNDPKIANQPAAKEFAKLAPEEQIQQLHEH
eukprot:m.470565 g.470565  ORF g.470565 m.470565 type:complete len:228 (-) comp20369_c0_seq13:130-813(-)